MTDKPPSKFAIMRKGRAAAEQRVAYSEAELLQAKWAERYSSVIQNNVNPSLAERYGARDRLSDLLGLTPKTGGKDSGAVTSL